MTTSHVLLKASTAIPSKDKLHPVLKDNIPIFERMAKAAQDHHGLTWSDFNDSAEWIKPMESVVREYGSPYHFHEQWAKPFTSGVYSFPFLREEYIEDLLNEISAMSFEVNAEEDALVQIPEITLADNCRTLHDCLHSLFQYAVKPLAAILYNLEPKFMQSIQFAQYTPENTAEGHWHHDEDSDITLVVALTNNHVGGGTMVKPQGLGEAFEVPQLPVGHAMLFQGSRTLHYGLPVTEGARNLLVFWSTLRP
jgi:hypothetical protein